MSKVHYFQRYSSKENSVTNNTLQLMAKVYNNSPEKFSLLLGALLDSEMELGIKIRQQIKSQKSVPDGMIFQSSVKILIECKVDADIDIKQLIKHASGFGGEERKILILLTREGVSAEVGNSIRHEFRSAATKHNGSFVEFFSITFTEVCDAALQLYREYDFEMRGIIDDFVEYCNDMELINRSKYLLRIVGCGKSFELNVKYKMYYHESGRGFEKHDFIGVYSKKSVRWVLRVKSVVDVDFVNGIRVYRVHSGEEPSEADKKSIDGIIRDTLPECGWDISSGHRFFVGSEIAETDFVKSSFGGIRGQRYYNLREIAREFDDLQSLARRLRTLTWT